MSDWYEKREPLGGGGWELVAQTNSAAAAEAIGAAPLAECGCPLRLDGTDPYLHRDGCPRQGEVQVERWLAEQAGLRSDEVRCKLCNHGSDSLVPGDLRGVPGKGVPPVSLWEWLNEQVNADEESAYRMLPYSRDSFIQRRARSGPAAVQAWAAERVVRDEGRVDYWRVRSERSGEHPIEEVARTSDGPAGFVAQHIAEFGSPRRVLTQVDATRRLLRRHRPKEDPVWGAVCDGCGFEGPNDNPKYLIDACPELRDLAAVYAGRDGFREEEWGAQ